MIVLLMRQGNGLNFQLFNCRINNAQAEDMFTRLVKERASREGVNERLKAEDQMRWVHEMNRISAEAREIVDAEMIFG